MLVPQPAVEPVPPAVESQSSNHWTAKEFPQLSFIETLFLPFQSLGREKKWKKRFVLEIGLKFFSPLLAPFCKFSFTEQCFPI